MEDTNTSKDKNNIQSKDELNNINSKFDIQNIKNKYILKKLFDNIKKYKLLEIFKYNKNIQKRLNININTYKEYSEIYTSIEIELIPIKNSDGEFINIRENEKKYFHIYFNESKNEINNNILLENNKISKIKIIIDYQVKSFEGLFTYCECINSISFKKFYRNTYLYILFNYEKKL